jgi:hypothetical protein
MLPQLGACLSQTEEGATVLATAWWPRLLRRWELVEKITVTMIQLGGWAASALGWEMREANSKLQAAALQLYCGAAAPSGCILIAVTPRGPVKVL